MKTSERKYVRPSPRVGWIMIPKKKGVDRTLDLPPGKMLLRLRINEIRFITNSLQIDVDQDFVRVR